MNQLNITPNLINEQTDNPDIAVQVITDFEKEIIKFIGQGSTNKQIADKLSISPENLDKIIAKLLAKTNTRNLAHLMMYAAVNNVLDI